MIKMLIVVVVCYTVCWLPFNVYWVSMGSFSISFNVQETLQTCRSIVPVN